MITLSPRIIALLSHPVIEPFYLVQIDGNTRLTTYPAEIALSDGKVYIPGHLVSLDPPKLSSSVDREAYKITIADPNMEYGAMFEDGMVGVDVEVRVGFIDQETGLPELDANNTFLIYKGVTDGLSYQINIEEVGESIATITCTSPMANLDMAKPFHTSKDFIRNLNPADSSFDQIYEGAGTVQLKWGKA
jgi:hypothetical protein